MDKWEYRCERSEEGDMQKDLNRWGATGWELVSCAKRKITYTGNEYYDLVLKRRKESKNG